MNTEIFSPEEAKHHHHVKKLLEYMLDFTKSESHMYDFGAGDGYYVENIATKYPLCQVHGVEGSRIRFTLEPPVLPNLQAIQWDLTYPAYFGPRGFVSCIEVAEHIHAEKHDTLMDTLSRHCREYLLLTWAVRGQGGCRHVSERNESEVVPYVEKWGFGLHGGLTEEMRKNVGKECGYMKNSIYIFQRNS